MRRGVDILTQPLFTQVDCAFYTEDMQEVQFNPVEDLKKALEAAQEQDEEDKCPECFDNQLKWFCASVVPKCGSVRASIESAILPAVAKVNLSHSPRLDSLNQVQGLSYIALRPSDPQTESTVQVCIFNRHLVSRLLAAYSDVKMPTPCCIKSKCVSAIPLLRPRLTILRAAGSGLSILPLKNLLIFFIPTRSCRHF